MKVHFPVIINILGWLFLFVISEMWFNSLKDIPGAVTRGSVSQIFLLNNAGKGY